MRTDRLTAVYEDPGPFATAYVDVSRDVENPATAVELAIRSATDALLDSGAPEDVVQIVEERLGRTPELPAPVSRCVVVNARGTVLLDDTTRTDRTAPTASWGALPDLTAWVADADATVPFVLVLVDHEGGDVSVHRSGVHRAAETSQAGGETAYEHKVRGGGWSHLRWQHSTENVWERNAHDVVAEVRTHLSEEGIALVLLAGQPDTRAQVREALADQPDVTVRELDAGSRHADGGDAALAESVERALEEVLGTRAVERNEELAERFGRDDAVATGLDDVLDAFVAGQVDRVLLDPTALEEREVEPARHPGLAFGAVAGLPERVPAGAALIAAATVTGAAVEAVPRSLLFDTPVAALLRWNAPSTP